MGLRFAGRGGLCTPWPAALRAVDAVQADANRADSEFDVDGVGADHFGDDAGEDRARVVVGASGRRVGVRCDARCYFSSANPGGGGGGAVEGDGVLAAGAFAERRDQRIAEIGGRVAVILQGDPDGLGILTRSWAAVTSPRRRERRCCDRRRRARSSPRRLPASVTRQMYPGASGVSSRSRTRVAAADWVLSSCAR